ncbi:hypothetical protein [Breoghania sp.]|uniref:hypothetical protein n=1 Tax=Breoghania sp. TaxID=2065378 RepID=UPI00261044C5|nr:hypothetical protein [Breoghania sp.]MDJ0933334.1 hypothetical protein [Breoghania sp.]
MDSVPHGSNYDGAVGVILGVALQRHFAESGTRPPFDLTVACLRAEESCWFPHSYIGSKMALDLLDPDVLTSVTRSDDGEMLGAHIDASGFDAAAVARGKTFLDPATIVA